MFGKTRIAALAAGMVVTLGAGVAVAPASVGAAPSASVAVAERGTITSRVVGSFGVDGVVRGHFVPERFYVNKGRVWAHGVLHATLKRADGTLVGHKSKAIDIPVKGAKTVNAARAASCDILNLVLGPLDLNILGLEVHLKKVVLDIVAQSGSGNLLGNLLCAVAGLLDGVDTLSQLLKIANLLNRILGILG